MGNRITQDECIDLFMHIHGDKYDYSKVVYTNKTTKVKIICPDHGVFEQTPKQHIKGRGCFECGKVKASSARRSDTSDFITKSVEVHGDRYDYSLVEYVNNQSKVKIICSVHGVFEQRPDKHQSGQGCPVCRYIKSGSSKRLTQDECIDTFKSSHGERYDYSLVDYDGDQCKVKIVCPIHGVFEQIPLNHKRGQGCPLCKSDQMKSSTSEFITKAVEVHGNRYDYSLVDYITSKEKVKIVCPIHGVFEQRPNNHLNNQNCPVCMSKISNQEIELQEWISQYVDITTNNRSIIPPLELDIVIPSHKIAIEYNGIYWHSEQRGKGKYYHLDKYTQCKDAGYRLIQVWENEWLYKKDIVKSIILSALGVYERKVHGRKCGIVNVNSRLANKFYSDNHIQGFKGGMHHGLRYEGEIVSLMTINRIGVLERFANKRGVLVHGGFSKLLRSFDNINDLVTFTDVRYFTGKVYESNGFEFQHHSDPNYFYFNRERIELYSRVQFQKHKLEGKLNVFNPDLSEYQNMINNGYDRIWDCGNKKYVYRV